MLEPMICEALRIVSSFDLNAVQSFMNRITDRILEKEKRIDGVRRSTLVRDVVT